MSPVIRDARPEDADRIGALLTQLGYPTTSPQVADRLVYWNEDAFSRVLVADASGSIHGCLSIHGIPYLEQTGRWARIESLVVDQAIRASGVGRLLVAAAEDTARGWGCLRMEVTSSRDRRDAHAFYQRLGYADVCARSGRFLKDLD
jgi:GNAT superfamily N-acetyltransferase